MKKVTLAIAIAIALSGCAASVVSSSPRSVTVNAGIIQIQDAQNLADAECKKHNRLARMATQPRAGVTLYQFDCIE